MVGGEAHDVVIAEHIGREALQRVLRADLDEDPRARVVEGVQALDELHGRGDLAREHVEHLLDDVAVGRIELAVDVRDDRQLGRTQAETLEHRAQRDARRRDDLGVERVADGQRDRRVAAPLQLGDRQLDRLRWRRRSRPGGSS